MNITKSVWLLALLICVGCVPSLHQLYTSRTLVYDASITGRYLHDNDMWEFIGDPNTLSYGVTIHEKGEVKSDLIGHLVEVDGQRFLDLYPSSNAELEGGEWIKLHLIAIHLFWKVEKNDQGITLAAMNPDAVEELLEGKPFLVKHEVVTEGGESRVVLTDSPETLQRFLIQGQELHKEFFGDPVELKRFR